MSKQLLVRVTKWNRSRKMYSTIKMKNREMITQKRFRRFSFFRRKKI